MPLSRWWKHWILILLVVTVAVGGGSVILSKVSSPKTLPLNDSSRRSYQLSFPSATPFNIAAFRILYQDPGDKEGRTVIYTSADQAIYNGAGLQGTQVGELPYVVGLFDSWENVSGSADKLLILKDPIAQAPIAPIRVAFSPSSLFPKSIKTTQIAAESINKARRERVPGEGSEDFGLRKVISDISPAAIGDLIRSGDALVVIPLGTFTNKQNTLARDNQGRLVAHTIMIRRYEGGRGITL